MRRLKTLVRSAENVFAMLPPDQDRTGLPSRDNLFDAQINIQAAVMNAFGATDNLAWVWVKEKGITTKPNGKELKNGDVGLRPNNAFVRSTLSAPFQEYLTGLDAWFVKLEEFRHPLAHRIPLYVPPYVVTQSNHVAYQELETAKSTALSSSDFDEHERLSGLQEELATFQPLMQHSFIEQGTPMLFHPQLLANFNTIHELGMRMIEELDR